MADPNKPEAHAEAQAEAAAAAETASVRRGALARLLSEPTGEATVQTDDSTRRTPRARSSARASVPPADVLERVNGRVLDPSTALTVKGVDPRPTVYVGPRLLVSRGPQRRGDRQHARAASPKAWAGA